MIKFMSTAQKIYTLIILNHIIAVLGLIFLSYSGWWFLVALLGIILIGKIGGEIGYHRYFSHHSFKTKPWKEKALLFLGAMNGMGSTMSWCGTHRLHHRYADTDKDPHSPYYQNNWKLWLSIFKPFTIPTKTVSDLIRNPMHLKLHKYYFEIVAGTMILLALINPLLVLFFVSIPAVVQFHTGSFLIDIVCHKWGTRNYEVNDHSRNNKWVVLLTGGSGLHNNHHGQPWNAYYNHKPGEVDLPGLFIKYCLATEVATGPTYKSK